MRSTCAFIRASTGKAPVAPRRNRRGMQVAETRTLQPNCPLCQCRCDGLPFRHGGGGRHLGCAERVARWRRQSSSIRLHCILPCTARADLRYSGHCALCSKAGAGDLGAGPGNSSHRLWRAGPQTEESEMEKRIVVLMAVLALFCAGCGAVSHMDESESLHCISNTVSQDCYLCGDRDDTPLSKYWGQENVGIVSLSTF